MTPHTIVLFKIKVILMKKLLAVLMVLSMIFALSACASKEYKDTVVTVPVTDESGEEVTDEAGEVVTEVVTDESTAGDSTEAEGSTSADKAGNETTKKTSKDKKSDKSNKNTSVSSAMSDVSKDKTAAAGKDKTTAKSDSKTTASSKDKATTAAPSKTETTTKKPEKREVSVQIVLPYYNDLETQLSVFYQAEGDRKPKKLEFENPENKREKLEYDTVKLDGKTVMTYELGKMKGDVTVRIEMTGVDITDNEIVISAFDDTGKIIPVTGIEMMDGIDD